MTSTIKVNKIEKVDGSTIELGGPGTAVNLASGATQSGFGRTGTVDWCTTAKTSPFAAVSGDGFFVNTTSGGITVTLPSSPSQGDIVAFKDYAGTWNCNSVTVARNGSKINGQEDCATLSTQAQSVTLIYVDGTKGWQDIHDSTSNVTGASFVAATGGNTTITCGNFKTHIFTADGPLNVTSAGNAAGSNTFEYVVVAGGGNGGAGSTGGSGAGAGAGGFRYFTTLSPAGSPLVAPAGLTASVADVPISVGGGGTAYPNACGRGTNGGSSVFSTITSAGGGAGGTGKDSAPQTDTGPQTSPTNRIAGVPGGSGGGARGTTIPANSEAIAGVGNTPPVAPPQGNPGGDNPSGPEKTSGGGGGAGAAGSTGTTPQCGAGNGGDGGAGDFVVPGFFGPTAPSYGQSPSPLAPNGRYFSGGGAGNGYNAPASGDGGAGGGGDTSSIGAGGAGDTNTGGGGGGGSGGPGRPFDAGGTGGSGFVAIRYKFQ